MAEHGPSPLWLANTKEQDMTFTTTELANEQVLVEGVDYRGNTGSQVVWAHEWNQIKRAGTHKTALAAVDQAIADLIAPVKAAAEAANEALKMPDLDPMLYVVEQEGSEGVEAQQEITRRLSQDSIILRAIEEGRHDRLIWVNGVLVLTAAPVPYTAPATPVSGTDDDASGDPVSV